MKILVLNWRDMTHPQAGGAEVHLHQIFGRLAHRGHEVILLTTRHAGAPAEDHADGMIIYRFGHTYLFNWEAPRLIRKVMERHGIDIVVDDVNKIPFFTPVWHPAVPCGVMFHHLFGSTIFSLTPPPFALYVLLLERLSSWGYRHTPCCAVSRSTVDDLVRHGLSRDTITIVENSVDTKHYCPDPAVKKEDDLLLYLGRLKNYKNLDMLLELMGNLMAKGRGVRLLVGGTGDDEQRLKRKAADMGLSDRVEFLGFVPEEMKVNLFRRATLLVNPSRKEGWGITSIEANACGTAVVANGAPGLRDSVQHGQTGLLCRENDPVDLTRCVEELLDDREYRSALEHGGIAWANSFSWDRSAEKVEKWLQAILAGRRS